MFTTSGSKAGRNRLANVKWDAVAKELRFSTGEPAAVALRIKSTGFLVGSNFTSTEQGLVPASGGGTTNFLRADGTFAAPPGGSGSPGGADTNVQYNNGGSFGGDSAFNFDDTSKCLVLRGTATQHVYHFSNNTALVAHVTGDHQNVGVYRWQASNWGGAINIGKSRGTSVDSFTVIQNGDELGSIVFWGTDGAAFVKGAQIVARVDGSPGSNDMPTRLAFLTTADGASSSTERLRIDSAGRMVWGGTASVAAHSSFHAHWQQHSNSSGSGLFVGYFTNDANGPDWLSGKSRNATVGSHTVVQSGDRLGNFVFVGSDGDEFIQAARIAVEVDGTPGNGDMPGRILFMCTPDGSSTPTERLRIGNSGINPSTRIIENEVNLSDAANVTLDSSLGNTFKLTAVGSRTIDAPTNKPASGKVQKIVIMHEASGADRTLTLATGSAGAFRFGTDITGLTATTNGLVDYIGCIYNDADDRWDVVSYVKGF